MGSPYVAKIANTDLPEAQIQAIKREIETRLNEVNRQMSHYQPESELSRFNRAAAREPFPVSAEFASVLRFSLDLGRRSGGAFDPALGSVINLWGFGEKSEERRKPSPSELAAALNQAGLRHLEVLPENALIKKVPGLAINLSAVAKGFAVDQAIEVFLRHGLTNVYFGIAGDVRAMGRNARGTAWQIGIAAPVSNWREDDPMEAVVALSNQAVSTSGDYQKFFLDADGRRLCHIFDPKTGSPVQHNLGSVSVVAGDSMTADALSTTLFVLGPEAGLKFIEEWTNAATLFIIREGPESFRQLRSSGFRKSTTSLK